MIIEMFNGWYFFWLLLSAGAIVGLYFALRKAPPFVQSVALFSLLVIGVILHFAKINIPPYSEIVNGELVVTDRGWRDSWFVNICGANIALFPIMFLTKNKYLKDYMFYIGVISGLIALFYPTEPIDKADQLGEMLDVIRFYYHHWMLLAVPLLMVLFKKHKLSYKRVWVAPVGLLLLMLFIMLNQIFQSELGFIPLRNGNAIPNYKNTSFIWGPLNQDGSMDPIGGIFEIFTPECFKTLPVSCGGYGHEVGAVKYWPWFWLICPVFVLVTPLAFLVCMIFDNKALARDTVSFVKHIKNGGLRKDFKNLFCKILATVRANNTNSEQKNLTEPTEAEENTPKNT